ncbi:GTP-binding protein [Glutamicibacter soli]|uniref:GTP-binding protein n=1 Tax=Glutamicibacter soli TaxID=453836 RepID=UPI003FD6418E
MSSAVPLTLLGGYLGAGKTTLVNDLLEQSAQRIAVLVNDFGAVNIDAKLIRTARSDSVELANGCLCCSLRDSVAETLQPLAGRGDFDRVVVEVSGVGNPAKLAPWQGFPGFAPGGLVVCADAGAIGRQLRDGFIGDTVLDQLRAAELVLLSKTDLLPEDRAKQAAQLVSQAAPQAAVLASPHGADRIAAWRGPHRRS